MTKEEKISEAKRLYIKEMSDLLLETEELINYHKAGLKLALLKAKKIKSILKNIPYDIKK
jgi:hypothetical protein